MAFNAFSGRFHFAEYKVALDRVRRISTDIRKNVGDRREKKKREKKALSRNTRLVSRGLEGTREGKTRPRNNKIRGVSVYRVLFFRFAA